MKCLSLQSPVTGEVQVTSQSTLQTYSRPVSAHEWWGLGIPEGLVTEVQPAVSHPPGRPARTPAQARRPARQRHTRRAGQHRRGHRQPRRGKPGEPGPRRRKLRLLITWDTPGTGPPQARLWQALLALTPVGGYHPGWERRWAAGSAGSTRWGRLAIRTGHEPTSRM